MESTWSRHHLKEEQEGACLSKLSSGAKGEGLEAEGRQLDHLCKSLQHTFSGERNSHVPGSPGLRAPWGPWTHPEEPLSLTDGERLIIPLRAKQERTCLVGTGRELPLASKPSLGISLSPGDLGFFFQFNSSLPHPFSHELALCQHSARPRERQGCKTLVPWGA